MSIDEDKSAVRRCVEAFDSDADLSAFDAVCSSDVANVRETMATLHSASTTST